MSALLKCTAVKPGSIQLLPWLTGEKGVWLSPQDLGGTAICPVAQKETTSFMEGLQPAMAVSQSCFKESGP